MKIVLIGSGNVASQLAPALVEAGHELLQIIGRNQTAVQALAAQTNSMPSQNFQAVHADAEIVLIAVKDDAIQQVLKSLPPTKACIAHTSGSIGTEVFNGLPLTGGSFYPLQTFTPNREVDFTKIPILIEANDPACALQLEALAQSVSNNVQFITSAQRRQLHVAAVFVNNFANHCYAIAEQWTKEQQLSFDLLRPLLAETAAKAVASSPLQNQTGPAMRNDHAVQKSHAEMLKNHPEWQKIYTLLSQNIAQTHHEDEL